ncbi:hypothetical protein ACIBEF_31365 [Micromonospora sp. NPDC050795]|uniref:hypothetical protein n=1 Tax=Micromonospora sp. NPDC050795 TaxID=3364282 RepID=UPI0037B39377
MTDELVDLAADEGDALGELAFDDALGTGADDTRSGTADEGRSAASASSDSLGVGPDVFSSGTISGGTATAASMIITDREIVGGHHRHGLVAVETAS